MDIRVGDIVTLKKKHPCGAADWKVLRAGADFRLCCTGCGHQVMMARRVLEKSIVRIVPVIKLQHPERDAAPLANALCEGGVNVAEITFRAAGAEKAMRIMREERPEITIGAGTVVYPGQVDAALEAGAEFIVSPGFDSALVEYCMDKKVPYYPGCTTATEYQMALKYGLEILKFFPAEQSGGIDRIRELADPFPMFQILPTGRMSLEKLRDYFSCPIVIACGVSYVVAQELIENQKWEEITDLCRISRDIAASARKGILWT